jgi:hypothetical protein
MMELLEKIDLLKFSKFLFLQYKRVLYWVIEKISSITDIMENNFN